MSGGFNVSVQQLHTHAATVRGVAADVGTAAEAASSERAGGLVYGVLFDVIALPFLNKWADSIDGSITSAQKVGTTIAHGLQTNAETYDAAEQGNKAHISKSGGH